MKNWNVTNEEEPTIMSTSY